MKLFRQQPPEPLVVCVKGSELIEGDPRRSAQRHSSQRTDTFLSARFNSSTCEAALCLTRQLAYLSRSDGGKRQRKILPALMRNRERIQVYGEPRVPVVINLAQASCAVRHFPLATFPPEACGASGFLLRAERDPPALRRREEASRPCAQPA